jgi:hypothetical protein
MMMIKMMITMIIMLNTFERVNSLRLLRRTWYPKLRLPGTVAKRSGEREVSYILPAPVSVISLEGTRRTRNKLDKAAGRHVPFNHSL